MGMIEISYYVDRPKPITAKIERWRDEAMRIRVKVNEALENKRVRADHLLRIEAMAAEIRQEIAILNARLPLVGHLTSAALWAEASDALRLVLLEITELRTALYRSNLWNREAKSGSPALQGPFAGMDETSRTPSSGKPDRGQVNEDGFAGENLQ
jgi:hypothetical protein